tara:strand:+ start:558 stop:995 length:438 start_codon:yes stop_codon:yes gene_type:complete
MTEKKVDLLKSVYNKVQYTKTIDTSFSELGTTSIAEDLETQPNVEEFFALYNELFYDIPPNGATNSHEFLVQQSGNYIGFESNLEEIEALQLEITQLRRDLLSSQILNIEQITGEKLDIDLDNLGNNPEEIDNAIQDIKKDLNIP